MSFESILATERVWPITYGERPELKIVRDALFDRLLTPKNTEFRALLDNLPEVTCEWIPGPIVTLAGDLNPRDVASWEARLKALIPWKKGPWSLFGVEIDAEWRSDLKWQRLEPFLPDLCGQRILDIGCHNGYFMHRLAQHKPDLVVGLEPYEKHWFTFQLIQHYAKRPELRFELMGVEHCNQFGQFFDVIFCMGILYHRKDPIGTLQKMRAALRKGGRIYIDCQGIPGDEPYALVPKGRYAGAQGIWWLPSRSALTHWIYRAGFTEIRVLFEGPLEPSEQRQTPWAPILSLADFLDPNDPSKTCEGYAAPERFYWEIR